jgi:hypothetical protein
MRRLTHFSLIIVIATSTLFAVNAEAQGNWKPGDFGSARFYLGLFEPQADSQYWDDIFAGFTGSPSDFEDFVFGADYLWGTSRNGGVLFGVSFYEGKSTQAYLDWVDLDGQDISHLTTLRLSDLTAAYVFRFGGKNLRPYVGGGVGLLWWQLREEGSFIDFADDDLPIIYASYLAESTTWEAFAIAGLDVRLSYRWSFFFEGRYRWAEDELNRDFAGFGTIDLSGLQFDGGFAYNF